MTANERTKVTEEFDVERHGEVPEAEAPLVDELSKLRASYERLQRMDECKDELLSMVSHELRGTTSIILNASGLLSEEVRLRANGGESSQETLVNMINRHCRRMMRLLDDLLECARIDEAAFPIQREPLDVTSTVDAIAEEIRVVCCNADLQISCVCPSSRVIVHGDEGRITQAIINVLRNARRFADSEVRLLVRDKTDSVEIVVEDDGDGIPEDELPRIFERYHRTNDTSQRDGFGLGLTIVRAIVEGHDGTVWAENRQDNPSLPDDTTGARIIMSFPKADARLDLV